MNYKRVSIIIPVYNGANYMREAIDSALGQTYSNIEIIVINDGSNDNGATEKIAKEYGDKIIYVWKENGGVATALNLGIQKMSGEYFCWLSHDDIYKPRKVEEQMKYYEFLSEDTVLYSGYEVIDEKSSIQYIVDNLNMYGKEKLNHSLFPIYRGIANGCTIIMHKNMFNRYGLFNEELRTTQDYDLWFRIFKNENIYYCSEINVQMRIHSKQGSRIAESHVEEQVMLWKNIIENTSDEDIYGVYNSAYLFWSNTCEYLKKNKYNQIICKIAEERIEKSKKDLLEKLEESCVKEIIKIVEEYENLHLAHIELKNMLSTRNQINSIKQKIIMTIKRDGILMASRKILKFFLK